MKKDLFAFNGSAKQAYMKPAMRIVEIRQRMIICGSGGDPKGVKSFKGSQPEGFDWQDGGLDGEDY